MSSGLDGIVAAQTVLSHVDGEAGELILRGRRIEDIAGQTSFADAVAHLWLGTVDAEIEDALLGEARQNAFKRLEAGFAAIAGRPPMDGMRSLLCSLDAKREGSDPVALLAAIAVAAAAATRAGSGKTPLPPDPARAHAADLLAMLTGEEPIPEAAAALDTYLVTVLDHGLNASTFAARVVASTAAGLLPSVIAGLCALEGPLHGGAPGPVLDMLDAVGAPQEAPAWVAQHLAAGGRLMGFGHRIYRVRDPRADVLKRALQALPQARGRLTIADAVEGAALAELARVKPGRRIETNVEFATALLLDAVGVPRSGFTPLFAAGRAAGWIGHIREQESSGRLMRPLSQYVGPRPAQAA